MAFQKPYCYIKNSAAHIQISLRGRKLILEIRQSHEINFFNKDLDLAIQSCDRHALGRILFIVRLHDTRGINVIPLHKGLVLLLQEFHHGEQGEFKGLVGLCPNNRVVNDVDLSHACRLRPGGPVQF